MSKLSTVEVDAKYVDDLETDNFKMYKELQAIKIENEQLRKDLEVMAYQARLFQAQCDIYQSRDTYYPTVEEDTNPPWEPDSIEREEGL